MYMVLSTLSILHRRAGTPTCRSWPLGLVDEVRIDDPGLLHLESDNVVINGVGRIDPAESISSFKENNSHTLAEQAAVLPSMNYVETTRWCQWCVF